MCAAPAAAEQSAYNDAIRDRVQAMIDRHAFAEFEALADSYRMTNSHSPSGSIDLASFHKWLQYSVLQLDNCENCAGKADAFVEAWLRARPHDKIAHITYANVLLAHAGESSRGGLRVDRACRGVAENHGFRRRRADRPDDGEGVCVG